MFEFNIPTGFKNKAQGCGTPLPWVGNRPQFPFTPRGLRHIGTNAVWEDRRNSVGVEKRDGETSLTQGSGVPQPWAMICNPIGILNTYVGISIPYPERKDVGNDKSCTWERTCSRSSTLQPWSSAGIHRLKRCEKGNRISREIAFPNEIWEREEFRPPRMPECPRARTSPFLRVLPVLPVLQTLFPRRLRTRVPHPLKNTRSVGQTG